MTTKRRPALPAELRVPETWARSRCIVHVCRSRRRPTDLQHGPHRGGLVAALVQGRDRICLLYADVGNLAHFNYRYGLDRGDAPLVRVWDALRAAVEPHPTFRFGGDDFVALVPEVEAGVIHGAERAGPAALEASARELILSG